MDYLTVELNAASATLKVKPINGAFYVSAPEVCKALGLKYSSDATSINVAAPSGAVKMALDSNKYIVGQNSFYVETSPVATKDGIMLPVSVLGDVLGLSVNWSTEGTKIVGRASKL
ncbi:MAG: copper amine oxidase N-terminal domain-containing protein [Candidatus Adiutrix sp.]|nr:copper amine oxidase N-terminal domain-containing protein [Candidatus Adiutrix sp.]